MESKDKNFSEISLREDIKPFNAAEKLVDIKLIGTAIMQCLIENDPAGFIEVIEGHLEALNVSNFSKKAGVPRSTIYKLLKNKNPTIQTLAKIVHAAHSKTALIPK